MERQEPCTFNECDQQSTRRDSDRACLIPIGLAICTDQRSNRSIMNAPLPTLPSPCTGICKTDDQSDLCLGCGRSRDEIAEWPAADDVRRRAIWSLLPDRFSKLGITVARLPWSHHEIMSFVLGTLQQRAGTWVTGCYGATAEFMISPEEACTLSAKESGITAITARAALRLQVGDHVRALQLRDDDAANGYRAIFLVVLKTRASLPATSTLTRLGPDGGAIEVGHRDQVLYDLGLGRSDVRFSVRTSHEGLMDSPERARGMALLRTLSTAGVELLRQSPTRVVESALGRIEVHTEIPAPGGKSPDGPHTHLLSNHLSTGRSTQPGIELPPVYALGATYYPRNVPDAETPGGCAQ